MTNINDLKEHDKKHSISHRNYWWGPEGQKWTPEQQASYILEIETKHFEDFSKTVEIPISQLYEIALALNRIDDALKIDITKMCEILKNGNETEIAVEKAAISLKHELRNYSDMAAMIASQWLPKEDYKSLRKELKTPPKYYDDIDFNKLLY
jgi:hypothetical protein